MSDSIVRPDELFKGADAVDRFDALVTKMAKKAEYTDALAAAGNIAFTKKEGVTLTGKAAQEAAMLKAGVSADLVKEWTTSAPVSSTPIAQAALTPYDYEQEVLWLVPNDTPVRNSVAREKGQGEGTEYRRLTGISNSRTAGAANLSPFFASEGSSNVFGSVNLNRASVMAEVGDKFFAPYVEMGLQSQVSMKYQFAAQGFADIRALQHLALLRSGWFAEENALLNGSATALSVASLTATAATDTTVTGSGLPAISSSSAVLVTLSSSWGESQAVSAGTISSATAGSGIKLTGLAGVPANAVAINIYVTISGTTYKGTTQLVNGASPTAFASVTALPSTTADNGSYANYTFGGNLIANATAGSVIGYDGMVNQFVANGGYVKALNSTLSTSNAFSEFEAAFVALAQKNAARPDMIITTYSIRQALWDLIKNGNTGATNYRVNLESGDNGVIAGGAVASIANPATGDSVLIQGHRFATPGTAVIHSTRVPWADSNVSATVKVKSVVENMVLDFPQVGMTYDAQTYFYGTALFQAPVLSGIITSINA